MKILIVDDDNDIRDILEFTFSCEVEADFVQAASGNEAIKIIQNEKIDLIICDYNMPDGNGGDVYKFLIETGNPLPYVFCSSEHADEHDEFNTGGNLICEITKPYIFEGVQATILAFNSLDGKEGTLIESAVDYSSVSLDILLKFKILPCDFYDL